MSAVQPHPLRGAGLLLVHCAAVVDGAGKGVQPASSGSEMGGSRGSYGY